VTMATVRVQVAERSLLGLVPGNTRRSRRSARDEIRSNELVQIQRTRLRTCAS
jgi:hypothetical protein